MSKKDKDNTEEPLSDYGEPVSFNQVWEMFQETDKMFKETENSPNSENCFMNMLTKPFWEQWRA